MVVMSPGEYLRRRRVAAGLSLNEVSAQLVGIVPLAGPMITLGVASLEADVVDAGELLLGAMQRVFRFDYLVYLRLLAIHHGDTAHPPHLCRVCACSWHDPCIDEDGHGCSWARPSLCTRCDDPDGTAPAESPVDGGVGEMPAAPVNDVHATTSGIAA